MNIRKIAAKMGDGAIGAVLLASFAMFLGGAIEVCRCSPDPDGCGEACHVCVDEHAAAEGLASAASDCFCDHPDAPHLSSRTDSCQHKIVGLGELDRPTSTVLRRRASTTDCPPCPAPAVVLRGDVCAALRAVRFKPPDFRRRDSYSMMASRLYPRS